MDTITTEQATKYVERLIDLTKNGHDWKLTVIYAQSGAIIYDCRDGVYYVEIVYRPSLDVWGQENLELWVGKYPPDHPFDWRLLSPTNLRELRAEISKSLGLDDLSSGKNGFDVDEFIKFMNR